jgi:hypothetical protein
MLSMPKSSNRIPDAPRSPRWGPGPGAEGRLRGFSPRTPRPRVGWRLALQWTIANTAGWGIGFVFGFAAVGRFGEIIGRALGPLGNESGLVLVGAMVGTAAIPVAAAQWLVLRRKIDHAGLWVLAGTVGWIIGLAIGWSASMALNESPADPVHSAAMGAITGGIGGAVSGAMQWLVMRQEDTPSALWLPASVIGWGAAFAVAWSMASLISRFTDLVGTYAMIGIIVGCLGGAVTGIVLVWLLQQPPLEGQIAASA